MQCLSPSCLWQCFLIFRSQSKCQNCKAFVKIFNDNDKIVVASLKCSDIDSCDCNNQRYCGRTSESQLGLVIIQLPVCVFIYWQICVSLYFETYFQSAGESGGLSSNSVSRGSPPLLLSSSSQRSLSHRTQWLTARPPDTNWPSLRPETNIEERHILEETQRYTAEKKTEGEKKERAKRGGVVTCDKWEYLLHTGIYLFYSSSLSFNKTSLIKPFWQSYSFIGQIKLIVKYQLSKHKKLGCVSPFAWS